MDNILLEKEVGRLRRLEEVHRGGEGSHKAIRQTRRRLGKYFLVCYKPGKNENFSLNCQEREAILSDILYSNEAP